jgi:hypothetical protein
VSLAPAFRPGPTESLRPRAGSRIGSKTADPSVGFAISLTTGMCRSCGTQICRSTWVPDARSKPVCVKGASAWAWRSGPSAAGVGSLSGPGVACQKAGFRVQGRSRWTTSRPFCPPVLS